MGQQHTTNLSTPGHGGELDPEPYMYKAWVLHRMHHAKLPLTNQLGEYILLSCEFLPNRIFVAHS